ncbi:unnamed protein product [Boreogadus saida]
MSGIPQRFPVKTPSVPGLGYGLQSHPTLTTPSSPSDPSPRRHNKVHATSTPTPGSGNGGLRGDKPERRSALNSDWGPWAQGPRWQHSRNLSPINTPCRGTPPSPQVDDQSQNLWTGGRSTLTVGHTGPSPARPPASAPPGVGVRAGAGGGRPARSPGSPGSGRARRVAQGTGPHRGVFSVCDSVSAWVVNKTHATDISGHEVTVLPNVNVNSVNKKQYFFETSCLGGGGGGRGGGAAGAARGTGSVSSCLGIDARHWNSYCTNSHTFVRALTTYRNLVAWRHIRINVACECVVSRKSWAKS